MTDYEQLVKALRHCNGPSYLNCRECQYNNYMLSCIYKMLRDAAAAIEALLKENKELIEDHPEMVEADGHWEWRKPNGEVLLPKRGEWQKAKPKGVVTYSDGYAECSHCHEAIWLGWGMNFCPNCGTQNKIIDPDDYDGAKMEVQDG